MSRKISFSNFRFIHLLRIFCQGAFFCFFLVLLLSTHSSGSETIGAVERFFHFDPLLGLTTIIASRTFFAAFLCAVVTLLITALFGRYVCGWVCPLGSVLHFFSFLFEKLKWYKARIETTCHLSWKYLGMLFILVASICTLDFAGFLDPLSILYRSFATAVLPAISLAAGAGTDSLQQSGVPLPGDRLTLFFQNLMINTTFRQGLIIGLLFFGIILLNVVRPRFWCRYVCPAGALLGLFARWNLVKLKIDADRCNGCRACTRHCPSQASPHANDSWKRAECFYCYSCASRCPLDAISYPFALPAAKSPGMNLSRRKLVFTTTLGLAAAPVLSISGSERPSEGLIRPPGALPEPQFLAKCIKCGECMKVCPTNGLQHAYNEGSLLAIWTPVLVPRIGYCEYYCSLCTQVCPTGAIQERTVQEKQKIKIGSAWIRKHRCLPYSIAEPCRICEEKCPTSPKAILMVNSEFSAPEGMIPIQVPIVDPFLCIGCGICETKCPVVDEPGIYCTSYGDSRSEKDFSLPEYAK